ncbi:tetratricopeptide repeat protein [Opitutaceae bacterium]|nr:tetratricopeptide repeat protein [Opitutaceae bacterium]
MTDWGEHHARLLQAKSTVYANPTQVRDELRELLESLRATPADRGEKGPLMGQVLVTLSIAHRLLGEYAEGFQASDLARALFEAIPDEAGIAKTEIMAGNLHWCIGGFDQATRLFSAALDRRRRLGDRQGEAAALGSLGVVLDEAGHFKEALQCYHESLGLSRELADRMFEGRTLNNLAETYLKMSELGEASKHSREAVVIFRALDERSELANACNNAGRIALAGKNWEAAQEAFDEALAVSQTIGYRRAEAEAHGYLGRLLADSEAPGHSLEAARESVRIALALADELKSSAVQAELALVLTGILEQMGDLSGALESHRRYHEAQHAVVTEQAEGRIQRLTVEMELGAARAKTEELTALNLALESQSRQLHQAVNGLMRLDDEKNALLGMTAHDVKAPLLTMMVMTEELLGDPNAGEAGLAPSVRETVQGVHDVARGSYEMVNALLNTHSIQVGHRELNPLPLDCFDLLGKVVKELALAADRKGIRLDAPVMIEGSLRVVADPLALRQILTNLLSNAVKFTPSGGTVEVRCLPEGDQVVFVITDSGPGFTAEDRAELYEPFGSRSAQPTGGEGSSGLGLHLVKQLVDECGGMLTCESEPGDGATFRVSLPGADS